MTERNTHLDDLLGSRRDWTPIALLLARDNEGKGLKLLDLARDRRWQLVTLAKFDGNLPANIHVRGAITDLLPTDEHPRALREMGVPTVRLGSWPHPDDPRVPAVMPDRAADGRLAAEHFAERDFEHVACVGHTPWGENRAIYEAFESRAQQLGCACHLLREENLPRATFASHVDRLRHRQDTFARWVTALPRPVGLLAFGDAGADRFGQWVMDAGLRVPEDVAVLGIGNDRVTCECATVPISSIAHDVDRIVTTAADTLATLIAGRPLAKTTITVPPLGVVTRQSTDVLAAADPNVAKALRFMWDHVTEDLSVDQIARHVGVSRRTLERAFRDDIGRTIQQEYQRRRLERACELLVQTDMQVAEIAAAMGFSSRNYFFEVFRKTHGISPGQYRQRRKSAS